LVAWLKRIATNKSLTQLKKEQLVRGSKNGGNTKYSNSRRANQLCFPESKSNNEKISSLKQNYQLVLTLNLIEGYDYEEIAQIMGYTNENVRTIISRAKKKLK